MTAIAERPSTVFHGAQPHVAAAPAEERGLARDGVRLLVARASEITHTTFTNLVDYLQPGDALVVNTSATVNGEVDATLRSSNGSRPVVLHLATPLPDGSWVLELRTFPNAARPVLDADPGALVGSRVGRLRLLEPYRS
ncbi:MAG: S-adenosylmethionine:tRNA ribosyltransferase-isomerase, partial [Dermatophilaceae bacterium]